MSFEQAVAQRKPPVRSPVLRSVLGVVVALFLARTAARWMEGDVLAEQPAGLGRGFLHGAIMPLAMPGLLIGWDAEIYSPRNTGRTYKLGYTLGVDVCGAAFFGWSFRRWSRWRK